MPQPEYALPPWVMPHMHARYRFIDGLAEDMLGYIFPRGNGVGVLGEPGAGDGTDRFGCGHSDDSESTGSRAGDVVGNALVDVLDKHEGAPEDIHVGRYVLPDGTLSRDPLGPARVDQVRCRHDVPLDRTGGRGGRRARRHRLCTRPPGCRFRAAAQRHPDRNTRGWIDARHAPLARRVRRVASQPTGAPSRPALERLEAIPATAPRYVARPMELAYSEADEAFRAELRAWLDQALADVPAQPHREDWDARRKWDTDWQRRLFDAGYAGLHWPAEVGGRGASPTEQLIFYEETTRADAPYVGCNFVGLLHAGPTLIAEGSDAQKAAHLPKMLRGEEVWCQGFSEPGAGTDLASLRTRAERDGDDYVVNGQKIWCSFGHIADVGEFLVRTDPDAPKHKGISWLILPMDLPGIEIRPIKTVLGSSEFCEVFLNDVRVPSRTASARRTTAGASRTSRSSTSGARRSCRELIDSLRLAADVAPLVRDDAHRVELGRCRAEFEALWSLTKRNVSQQALGRPSPGSMMIKLAYSEARQRFGELCLRVLDRDALAIEDNELVEERLRTLALTIAAGAVADPTQHHQRARARLAVGAPMSERGCT